MAVRWNREDDVLLARLYREGEPLRAMSERLGRSDDAIVAKDLSSVVTLLDGNNQVAAQLGDGGGPNGEASPWCSRRRNSVGRSRLGPWFRGALPYSTTGHLTTGT